MFKTYLFPDGHEMDAIEFGHGDLAILPTTDASGKRYLGIKENVTGPHELGSRIGEKENFYKALPTMALVFTSIPAIDNIIRMLEDLKTMIPEEQTYD